MKLMKGIIYNYKGCKMNEIASKLLELAYEFIQVLFITCQNKKKSIGNKET